VDFHQAFEPAPGLQARFSRAGHILGSACLGLKAGEATLGFSGDVGRPADPIMRPPEGMPSAGTLVVESTYGDRRHSEEPVPEVLARIVNDTVQRKGALIVPAFAVGRAQHMLHLLADLKREGRIPALPVFLDSPMAIQATDILERFGDDHRLTPGQCRELRDLARYTRTPDESKAIDQRKGPMIVISASGMATGGRILHHLKKFLPGQENTVLLVGYQAAGTRGRSLADGAEEIKLQGRYVPVRARVVQVQGLSAHADHAEMLDWLGRSGLTPQRVFVTHGEPAAADAFRRRLKDTFGWEALVPPDGSAWDLG
jgi:metallo-beta-lactamase family protein